MIVRLDDVKMTSKDGKLAHLDQLYLRWSHIKFIFAPDMFKNSPMFKKIENQTKAAKQANIAKGKVREKLLTTNIPRGKELVAKINL